MGIKTFLFLILIIIVTIISLTFFNIIPVSLIPIEDFCISSRNCELSLCDCDCHQPGQTPEDKRGIVCGKNCEAWFNVSGCECNFFRCEKILK